MIKLCYLHTWSWIHEFYHIESVHCMGNIPLYFYLICFQLATTRYFLLWTVWETSKFSLKDFGVWTVHCRRILSACLRTCKWLAMWTIWRASWQTLHVHWSKYSMVPTYEIWKTKVADGTGLQMVPDKTECHEVLSATPPRWDICLELHCRIPSSSAVFLIVVIIYGIPCF
jgi:hypothetical protein